MFFFFLFHFLFCLNLIEFRLKASEKSGLNFFINASLFREFNRFELDVETGEFLVEFYCVSTWNCSLSDFDLLIQASRDEFYAP